jgi:phosphohistidine swiveling domain-containing protein
MTKSDFLARYGHLRPGTYDILSPRYDEAPDLYFNWDKTWQASMPVKSFSATLQQAREIEQLIKTSGLHTDLQGLFDFIRTAIELREFAKFQLTRNLSDILRLTVDYGGTMSIPAADLAYCEVACIKELHIAAMDHKEFLVRNIDQGKLRYADTLKVSLPPLITKPEDVWAFELPVTVPNFITSKQVTAPVVSYDDRENLDGALVCIPNADPGFDWLFAWPIAGLITAWGGANSHMAIRAGELGLPAVLGAGEALYQRWSNARRLHIDCASRRVEVLL